MSRKITLWISQYIAIKVDKEENENYKKCLNSEYSNIRSQLHNHSEFDFHYSSIFIDDSKERKEEMKAKIGIAVTHFDPVNNSKERRNSNYITLLNKQIRKIKRCQFLKDDIEWFFKPKDYYLERDVERNYNDWKRWNPEHSNISSFIWDKPFIFELEINDSAKYHFISEVNFPFKKTDLLKFKSKLEEMLFLETHKNEIVEHSKKDIVFVPWKDVEFKDKKISILIEKELHQIDCYHSNSEINNLKQVLFRKSKNGIAINISSKYKIENEEVLLNVIKFLNIQLRLSLKALKVEEIKKDTKDFNLIQKQVVAHISKDVYFNYLLNLHDLDYPILPVLELNNKIEESSYILTIKRKNKIFLVWENQLEGRATYIFKTNSQLYFEHAQYLFDFIKADLSKKRKEVEMYVQSLFDQGMRLNIHSKLAHSEFSSWRDRLHTSFKS